MHLLELCIFFLLNILYIKHFNFVLCLFLIRFVQKINLQPDKNLGLLSSTQFQLEFFSFANFITLFFLQINRT